MRKKLLKPIEAELLAAIERIIARGQVPSFGVVLVEAGLTCKSTMSRRLAGLEAKGHIRRVGNRAGAIEVLPDPLIVVAQGVAEWLRAETGQSLSAGETANLAQFLKGKL